MPLLLIEVNAEGLRNRKRFERRADDMRGARAVGAFGRFRFEQLGVGEDHAQLIVQAVKQPFDSLALAQGRQGRSAYIVWPADGAVVGHLRHRQR